MTDPMAVIVRFHGDPDDLLRRFEQARTVWIEAQGSDCDAPVLYAICMAEKGIVVVTGWADEEHHRVFRRQMGPHLRAVGMKMPDEHEHLRMGRCGWDPGL